jgi:hypothetical protein
VQPTDYWSSTTHDASPAFAWGVLLLNGSEFVVSKTIEISVWPVRGGRGGQVSF